MDLTRRCMACLALLALLGYPSNATDELEPSSDDSVHVHLHNASHGAMLSGDTLHEVHATVLEHNDTHSVLHINSSTAGLHRDVLVHSDVLDEMGLGAPVNGSHFDHEGWSGTEQLVPTDGGWMSVPLNGSLSAQAGTADRAHQGTMSVVAVVVGACVGVAALAMITVGIVRARRPNDAMLLGEEDEEFTVFSVVDHPYPGKKGDSYSPLR